MANAFQPKFVDLVRNTTTTTGTDDFTLGAAVTGYTSFTAACQVGDSFYYSAIGIDKPAEREVGRGTLLTGGLIARDPIGGVKTKFSSGTKSVALITAAEWYSNMQSGAASGPPLAATRAALASATPQRVAILSESGRDGLFVFSSADLSAFVAADRAQGLHVAPAADPSGKSGAWVRHYDGAVSVKWFGATGDGVTDDSAAFTAAIDFLKTTATNLSINGYYKSSAALHVPAGKYYLGTTTLEISHSFDLVGDSSGRSGLAYATWLKWDDGATGVRIERYNTSGASTLDSSTHFGGDAFCIRNMRLTGGYSGTEGEYHGIHAKARFTAENIAIDGFSGDGIFSNADSGGSGATQGNTNCSRLDNVCIGGCRDGLRLTGGDSNAWTIIDLDTSSNRRWGRNDTAFLGNHYFGGHAADNGLIVGTPPSIVSNGGNRYAVVAGQDGAASTTAPTGTADTSVWYYLGPGGPNTPLNIPAWTSGMTVRAGGAAYYNNANAQTVVVGSYTEGGQGPVQGNFGALLIGGTQGAGVRGTIAWLRNPSGYLTVDRLSVTSAFGGPGTSWSVGPSGTAPAGDLTFDYHTTSNNITQNYHSWANGLPTIEYTLNVNKPTGAVQNARVAHYFEVGGAVIQTVSSAGINLSSGKVLSVGGTQVLGARKTGTSPDATDLASAIALANDLKAKLVAHGLIS